MSKVEVLSKLDAHKQNIGKKVKITYSIIAGVKGKTGTIKDVSGNDRTGYRYAVEMFENHSMLNDNTCFPPTYYCEIIE